MVNGREVRAGGGAPGGAGGTVRGKTMFSVQTRRRRSRDLEAEVVELRERVETLESAIRTAGGALAVGGGALDR